MNITLLAVGRLKDKAVADMCALYIKRLGAYAPTQVVEVVGKTQGPGPEGQALLAKIPSDATVVALDEKGQTLSTQVLSDKIQAWQDSGTRQLFFIIGGADGLSDEVRNRADMVLSLSKLTFPHMLVRPIILEQIYRCLSLAAGHPYHREG